MGFIFSLLIILIFWSLAYLINTFLIECKFTSAAYAKLLSKNGISVNILQIKWYTVKCNRLFIKISNWEPNFFKIWFNLGVIIGLVGQFCSIFLLFYTLIDFFRYKPSSEQILVPVLPGVNLPTDQSVYYLIALFLCGIFHEFGHAIAASREQVRVNGFGIFIMFIFPGAYVDLCTDHLLVLSPLRQLRIFCGGVWHNFVLVLMAVSMLQMHPYFVNVLYYKRAHVSYIQENSPLKSLIKQNSVILNVANCKVENAYSFYECLYKFEKNQNLGYCMPVKEIFNLASTLKQDEYELQECCTMNVSKTNYCFKWNSKEYYKQHYACMPARYVTDKKACIQNSDCVNTIFSEGSCVTPVWDNSTKLIRILHDQGQPVLYVGSLKELIYSVQIEDFMPKFKFIPKFFNYQFQLLLKYIIAFSGAIGILNLVPCFALDGQYILAALLSINKKTDHFVNSNEAKRPIFYIIIMIIGTILLLLNMILGLFSLIISKKSSWL